MIFWVYLREPIHNPETMSKGWNVKSHIKETTNFHEKVEDYLSGSLFCRILSDVIQIEFFWGNFKNSGEIQQLLSRSKQLNQKRGV